MNKFWNLKLKNKLIVLYILMAVIPIILTSTISYTIYYHNIQEKTNSLVEMNARQHQQLIAERLDKVRRNMYEIITNRKMIEYASSLNPDSSGKLNPTNIALSKFEITKIFESYGRDEYVNGIAFIANSNVYCAYARHLDMSSQLIWSNANIRKYYYDNTLKESQWSYFPTANLSTRAQYEFNSIYLSFPIKTLTKNNLQGVLVIALDEKILRSYGPVSEMQKEEYTQTSGVSTFIIDQNNFIISCDDENYITKNYHDIVENTKISSSSLREKQTKITDTPWKLVTIIDESVYLKDSRLFVKIVILFTIFITLIFLSILIIIFRHYMKSIYKISSGMKEYTAGVKNVQITLNNKDELYSIAKQFNNMTVEINQLVSTLKHKNIEIKNAVTRQKKAEIKALEAQINPHFLYNTLDSINWIAIEHNEMQISNMLGALGSILRYSVTNIDMLVSLHAEIEWLKKYIYLQRERFYYSFDCEYHIEPQTLDFPVYKMLLQPLVENIIIHAFEGVKSGGMITIQTKINTKNYLEIKIKDNGCGINPNTLKRIQNDIKNQVPLNSESIGISNVVNRLQLYYHGQAQIEILSEEQIGTEVNLVIPNTMIKED